MNPADMHHLRVISNPSRERAQVRIYKPFFIAGILSVLTAGCGLGAIALLGIAQAGDYTVASWAPYIRAHANSQIFGWVGLFVIGFALQQHSPSVARARTFHALAWISLTAMALGIALRFVAEPMMLSAREPWYTVGLSSTVLQGLAILAFVINIFATRHRSGEPMPWQSMFVFTSLGILLLMAVAEPFAFAASHTPSREESVLAIARWFPLLREGQFLGFVAMMIFGVALAKLNSCFGFPAADARLAMAGYGFWMSGLAARMLGWLQTFDRGLAPGTATLHQVGSLLIGVGAVLLIASTNVFRRPSTALRSHKFIRAAFAWLLVSAAMMALEPLHAAAIGAPFSHAYTGAIRHAVTVGFVSQIIVGVSLLVVARMNDIPEDRLPSLLPAFVLLNLGNALRVAMEVATDYSPGAFPVMGASGFLELIALALWGGHLLGIMTGRWQRKQAYVC